MKKAFTLIEMVIVLTIISILMGLVKNSTLNYKAEAESQAIVQAIQVVEKALSMYYYNTGSFDKTYLKGNSSVAVDLFTDAEPISDWMKRHLDETSFGEYLPKNYIHSVQTNIYIGKSEQSIFLTLLTSSEKVKDKCEKKLLQMYNQDQIKDVRPSGVPAISTTTPSVGESTSQADKPKEFYLTYFFVLSDGTHFL